MEGILKLTVVESHHPDIQSQALFTALKLIHFNTQLTTHERELEDLLCFRLRHSQVSAASLDR